MVKQGYKQTEIGVIPEDWDCKKLGGFAKVTKLAGFEFTAYVHYSELGKIIAVRGLNVKQGKLVLEDVKYIDNSNFSKLSRSKLYIDDLLFTYVGTVGEAALVDKNDKYYLAPNVALIRINESVLPKFCMLQMLSTQFNKSQIHVQIATSSQPALSMTNIRLFDMAIPPLTEQIRITEALSDIDNMISSLEKLIEKKKAVKQGAMQELLTGKKRLSGFTSEWRQESNIFSFSKGAQINSSLLDEVGLYPVYNGGREPSGYIDRFNCDGTIIISEGGNSCGFVNRVSNNFWAGGHCYYIYNSNLNLDFLYQLLKFYENDIMALRVGSGLPNIQKDSLNKLEFLYPSDIAEQNAIASILSDMDSEIEALEQKLAKTRQLKQGMMQQLLTGKIRLV